MLLIYGVGRSTTADPVVRGGALIWANLEGTKYNIIFRLKLQID